MPGRTPARAVSEPSQAPPDDVTGTWVDDEGDGDEMMEPIQPPEQLGAEPFADRREHGRRRHG